MRATVTGAAGGLDRRSDAILMSPSIVAPRVTASIRLVPPSPCPESFHPLRVQVIIILLTYINVLPVPWRIAIGVDAWGDVCRRGEEPAGWDFYDRPTESIWFHIPRQ